MAKTPLEDGETLEEALKPSARSSWACGKLSSNYIQHHSLPKMEVKNMIEAQGHQHYNQTREACGASAGRSVLEFDKLASNDQNMIVLLPKKNITCNLVNCFLNLVASHVHDVLSLCQLQPFVSSVLLHQPPFLSHLPFRLLTNLCLLPSLCFCQSFLLSMLQVS